jgi:hypothetical protein
MSVPFWPTQPSLHYSTDCCFGFSAGSLPVPLEVAVWLGRRRSSRSGDIQMRAWRYKCRPQSSSSVPLVAAHGRGLAAGRGRQRGCPAFLNIFSPPPSPMLIWFPFCQHVMIHFLWILVLWEFFVHIVKSFCTIRIQSKCKKWQIRSISNQFSDRLARLFMNKQSIEMRVTRSSASQYF